MNLPKRGTKGVKSMINMDDKIREKLEAQAAKWVEEELVHRMSYAREAIEFQADLSSGVCGEHGARKHIREATALAEENIRNELEFEAAQWVEDEMRKRTRPMLEDRNLEGNWC
ncbi:MAG: hypothetical protein JSV70_05530 [bacterium]|nr:MAG: hypothetical protein JSV70_05530 [bacterium]